jgi:hypothetical protein
VRQSSAVPVGIGGKNDSDIAGFPLDSAAATLGASDRA